MRSLVTIAILTCLVWSAPTAQGSDKTTDHVGAQPAWDHREGGETIESAIEITLPFFDTGATCDNVNDYDEACPYGGSISSDVVYTFSLEYTEYFNVDLFGSSYDTKVYIYDSGLDLVACNDDFYPDYTSRIEMFEALGGEIYYLVIDGYGGDCGAYQVFVSCMDPPCLDAVCPPGGMAEGEPGMIEGYIDTYNGGCDSDPAVFQELVMPAGQAELDFCGYTGWYNRDGIVNRDSDWFILVANGSSVHIGAESSHFLSVDVDVLYLEDCQDMSLLPYQAGICEVGEIDIPTYPGEILYIRVRPTQLDFSGCTPPVDLYTLNISGIGGPIANETMSWGTVKSLFR